MYSTPSKLRHSSNDPPTHLIITQATSSSEDEQTPFPPHLGSSPVLNDALTDEDDEKYGSMRIPVLNLGASASEAHSETQNLVVNAFHKVLSVLRQNRLDEATEPLNMKLPSNAVQIVPLLEEITYFLEQYDYTPPILSRNIKAIATNARRKGEDAGSNVDRALGSALNTTGPSYDYDTLMMILSEAHSFGFSLKMGLSPTAWLSAVTSINGVVLSWLSNLYRIPSHMSSAFIDDLSLCRQSILRTAIKTHFPTYERDGYRAFKDSTPVLLCTHFVPWIADLVFEVGLPQDCIRVGPNGLQELAPNDIVVAVYWILPDPTEPITWSEAQTDTLINYVSESGVWLHAEGYDTVLMTSLPDAASNVVAQIADSLVVDAAELLQIDRYPFPTLFYRSTPRTPQNPHLRSKEAPVELPLLNFISPVLRLELWFALQLKGYHFLSNIVTISTILCDQLYKRIASAPSIKILEGSDKSNTTLHFRYEYPVPSNNADSPDGNKETSSPLIQPPFYPEDDEKVTEYLFNYIQHVSDTPLPLELRRLSADSKLYIAWNPLRCYHLHLLARGHVNMLADLITQRASIITSSLRSRAAFVEEVSRHSVLSLVRTVPDDFVGLGAVRYRPEFASSLETEVGKQIQRWTNIIDELNSQILDELLQIHALYYPASSTASERCIGIHLDSSEMTLEKVQYHVKLILEIAARIEGESHFLDRVGELVKDGIKEAKEAIERTNLQRQSDKGLVRALPIVGRVWNWWSPYKPAPVAGTSFDLLSEEKSDE